MDGGAAAGALAVKGGFLEREEREAESTTTRQVFVTLTVDALLVYETEHDYQTLPLVPSAIEDWSARRSPPLR